MNSEQLRIEQKISESGTTTVYRAFDVALHRPVLLKVLHKHLAHDEDVRARFIREARACAALRSEHIVQVYDLTDVEQSPAIVMEFVEGSSLKDLIASGEGKGFDAARKTALHVLRALATAHEKKIIHRDIKPGNILVSVDGTMKVTDFGLASFALSPTVTMEGMVLGTPAYMAPEQVRGDDVDERTDLFALGATLVEVLSGERIFEGSTYTECMKKVLAFKEPELEKYIPHSSQEFVQFLKGLMHPDKNKRLESAKEALSAFGEKKSSVFLRPDAVQLSKRRAFIPVLGGAGVILLFILFGWMKLSQQPSGKEQRSNSNISGSIQSEDTVQKLEQSHNAVLQSPVLQTFNSRDTGSKEVPLRNVAKDSGKVFLASTPWAKVYIDNRLIGETPIATPFILAAGQHTVMFMNPSFEPIMKTITVEPGKEMTVTGNFFEHVGYVMCTVIPWADVYIDEQKKDTTPLEKPIMIAAGKHSVRFKNPAFIDIVREITVAPKETLQITISFIE
ncbi:MAG: serine/threonine-protein kinase [Bacteroidota bacterium]